MFKYFIFAFMLLSFSSAAVPDTKNLLRKTILLKRQYQDLNRYLKKQLKINERVLLILSVYEKSLRKSIDRK